MMTSPFEFLHKRRFDQERIMKEGRGGGKEREAPTHFIEVSVLTHAARVTKNSQTTRYYVAKRK